MPRHDRGARTILFLEGAASIEELNLHLAQEPIFFVFSITN